MLSYHQQGLETVLNRYVLLTSKIEQLHSLQAAVEMNLNWDLVVVTDVGIAGGVVVPVDSFQAIEDHYLSVPAIVYLFSQMLQKKVQMIYRLQWHILWKCIYLHKIAIDKTCFIK